MTGADPAANARRAAEMLSAPGIGVLYGRPELFDAITAALAAAEARGRAERDAEWRARVEGLLERHDDDADAFDALARDYDRSGHDLDALRCQERADQYRAAGDALRALAADLAPAGQDETDGAGRATR